MSTFLKFRITLFFVAGVLTCWGVNAGDLPNRSVTPGSVNPDVTQDNIQQTVCVKGWTKTVRPPAYYTNQLKARQIAQYGYTNTNPKDYEEDHLIPLSVGGATRDPKNLWPEPRKSEWGAEKKDQLEFAMYKAVCRGEVSLNEARSAFSVNWIDAYKHYEWLLHKYRYGRAD